MIVCDTKRRKALLDPVDDVLADLTCHSPSPPQPLSAEMHTAIGSLNKPQGYDGQERWPKLPFPGGPYQKHKKKIATATANKAEPVLEGRQGKGMADHGDAMAWVGLGGPSVGQ